MGEMSNDQGNKRICNTETVEFTGINFSDYGTLCNYMLYVE